MSAAKKADPFLVQAEETLDLLRRIRAEHGARLRWGLFVRLEEEIEALEERVDQWGQP